MADWPADSPLAPDGLPYCVMCHGMRVIYQSPAPYELTGKLIPCPTCGPIQAQARRLKLYRAKQTQIQRYTQMRGR